ncbi:heavy metal-associated isoprenylated plant protein 9-like [Camellia sinensis]|uniref:HMA domain-containing protein n=1 Tax=Camellia sinensis var. sinensis TaxID=542762 RepID=A0A4S4EWD0_CAMSN|nr:heavy metal-associated isoprenylated plant protein 9-like [Camellia sinensis]THG20972.1 hypothetical protein TEA_029848 [Camellia sinensis var. sinensis]
MGEEAKQEQAKAEAKPEEKKEEKTEEKKEEPKPPEPSVLFVDLHCVGCAKKIEKSILRIRGVEGVEIDMSKNQVTIKGVVEPQAVCTEIMKKTKRRTQVLSPLPAAEGEPIPEVVNSQVIGLTTVELNVNMHCEACAEQLKTKILKMRGVKTVTTELSSGKVTVTGTMDPNRLVDYVYRRTKKQAKIVPQHQPQPEPEPEKPEAKPEEKKEAEKPAEEPKLEEEKKEGETAEKKPPEEEKKEEAKKQEEEQSMVITSDEQSMQGMTGYYQPLYFIERIPPPQLFSDENPNACCIT